MNEAGLKVAALGIRGLKFRYGGRGPTPVAREVGAEVNGSSAGGDGGANSWTVNVVELDVMPGEQVLLGGKSGRGKSTLLALVAGLMDPAEGRVFVAGTEVHALSGANRDRFRGQHIGMIFQTFNLLHGFSAVENVMAAMMFGTLPKREHRSRAMELLRRLGIDRAEAPAENLSVGQQQRVAVARAVACDPALVLADEPTASLDPEAGATAMDLIRQVCRERRAALLCTSHDPQMAEGFERRLTLDELAGNGGGGK